MYNSNTLIHNSFDAACVRFARSENIESIASELDIRAAVLRNKLNPNQPHQLTVAELISITNKTENEAIVNGVILDLGLTVVRMPKTQSKKSLAMSALSVNAAAGDIANQIIEVESDCRLTQTKKDQIVKKAQSAMRELVFLMSDVENRCGGAGPFVSMCADAVMTGGVPMPGI